MSVSSWFVCFSHGLFSLPRGGLPSLSDGPSEGASHLDDQLLVPDISSSPRWRQAGPSPPTWKVWSLALPSGSPGNLARHLILCLDFPIDQVER